MRVRTYAKRAAGKSNGSKKVGKHFTKEQFLKAIENSGGYISLIAERVGCAIPTVYEWRKNEPEIAEAIKQEKVKQVDHAEGKLQSLIRKENPTAIIFYLKTQGKDRGYIERQELSGPDGDPLFLKWADDE